MDLRYSIYFQFGMTWQYSHLKVTVQNQSSNNPVACSCRLRSVKIRTPPASFTEQLMCLWFACVLIKTCVSPVFCKVGCSKLLFKVYGDDIYTVCGRQRKIALCSTFTHKQFAWFNLLPCILNENRPKQHTLHKHTDVCEWGVNVSFLFANLVCVLLTAFGNVT